MRREVNSWGITPKDEDATVEELTEAVEDHCLSKAMDEGRRTPLLERDDALAFLCQCVP